MYKKIKNYSKKLIALHNAGATVRHKSPFSNLRVLENIEPLDQEFIENYVAPFLYRGRENEELKIRVGEVWASIDTDLVSRLLGEFNWRPRSVGAYFAAVKGMSELEENIGNLLLRSDVCFAGHDYCLALASFSNPRAIEYLEQYLGYYLGQPDLWFDQGSAMAALAYIGKKSENDLMSPFIASWDIFVKNKPNWNLVEQVREFAEQMRTLEEMSGQFSS